MRAQSQTGHLAPAQPGLKRQNLYPLCSGLEFRPYLALDSDVPSLPLPVSLRSSQLGRDLKERGSKSETLGVASLGGCLESSRKFP